MDLEEQTEDVRVLLPQTLPWAQGLEIDQTESLSSGSSQGYESGTGVTYSGISAVTQGGAYCMGFLVGQTVKPGRRHEGQRDGMPDCSPKYNPSSVFTL